MLSKFLKVVSVNGSSKVCLFSTRYGSSVIVDRDFFQKIENDSISEEERKVLSSLGIIVNDQKRELEEVINLVERINKTRKILSLLIVLNLDCNLACKYCIEGTQKGSKYINHNTIEQIVSFIAEEIKRGKNISIDFYGGEPLLSYKSIILLMNKVNNLVREHKVSVIYNIVTNGTLLTEERAKALKNLGLSSAKITIDGDEENHNKFRPYKNGLPSFNNILENLKRVSNIIKMQLGGNYTKDNFRDFPKLLDRLLKEGLTPDKLTFVKFDPVSSVNECFSNPEFNSGCLSINEPWVIEASVYLREEILKRGFNTVPVLPSICVVDVRDELTINYNGDVYKCPAFLGMEEFRIGNVFTEIDYNKMASLPYGQNKECRECVYLPMCFGGCRYLSYLKTGRLEIDCKKEYLDKTLDDFIIQDIKYRPKRV
ncbi:MAG: geopeptide radical SAM maturase [Proteobacteria bacterium]|nr:geopeptide radical SAM maturase [Pseudomonadota bacterium]